MSLGLSPKLYEHWTRANLRDADPKRLGFGTWNGPANAVAVLGFRFRIIIPSSVQCKVRHK
jgi:hypothetical protein